MGIRLKALKMKILVKIHILLISVVSYSRTSAFTVAKISSFRTDGTSRNMGKGFGTTNNDEPRKKSEGQKKREQERSTYDKISYSGGQEYNIFVRQFGSDD